MVFGCCFFYVFECEGGCLKRAHLDNTHSQGFFKGFSEGFLNMSPPGVEPALSSWKVGVVTASPPSRAKYIYKCKGGRLKRAHLANTHSQGFLKVFLKIFLICLHLASNYSLVSTKQECIRFLID